MKKLVRNLRSRQARHECLCAPGERILGVAPDPDEPVVLPEAIRIGQRHTEAIVEVRRNQRSADRHDRSKQLGMTQSYGERIFATERETGQRP